MYKSSVKKEDRDCVEGNSPAYWILDDNTAGRVKIYIDDGVYINWIAPVVTWGEQSSL